MLMTGVVPDTFTGASSFLDDEIEYLELESLIDEVTERLDASWSYDLDDEGYLIEFVDDEGTVHEAASLSLEYCTEGFNEGRDLIICSVYLCDYQANLHDAVLPEILQLANQLTFTRVQISDSDQLELIGMALYQQESAVDVITAMVEEMSTLAADFRLKLEPPDSVD